MVCTPCRQAADTLARTTSAAKRRKAAKGHADCKGCTCQHKVEVG